MELKHLPTEAIKLWEPVCRLSLRAHGEWFLHEGALAAYVRELAAEAAE